MRAFDGHTFSFTKKQYYKKKIVLKDENVHLLLLILASLRRGDITLNSLFFLGGGDIQIHIHGSATELSMYIVHVRSQDPRL